MPDALRSIDYFGQTEERTCEKHGAYIATRFSRTVWGICPTCLSEEQRRQEEEGRQALERSRARKLAFRVERCRQNSGLIGRARRASFDSYVVSSPQQAAVVEACRAFVAEFVRDEKNRLECPQRSLWLLGTVGTGKSHLGAAMVNHLIDTYAVGAQMRSAREIVRMLRATWDRANPLRSPDWDFDGEQHGGNVITEQELIEDLGSAPLLVLDEVGVGFGSDAEITQLYDVLDLRYRNEAPTVVLSNFNAKELRAALGDRLFDRLREGATVHACTWTSHRI